MRRTKHRPDSAWSWLASVCACFYLAASGGFGMSFGVLLAELMDEFGQSRQKTVWVGSLAIALEYFLCPLASVLCKSTGCRLTAITGGVICAVSLLVSSYSRSLVLMYFTYSFLYGLGVSLIYVASLLISAKNFRKTQTLAIGVVSVGESVGVLIFGPFIQFLVDLVGWRVAFRIITALIFVACVLGASYGEPLNEENENGNQAIRLKSGYYNCFTQNKSTASDVAKSTESVNCNSEECLDSVFQGNHPKKCNKICVECHSELGASGILKTSSLSSVYCSNEANNQEVKDIKQRETSKLLDFSVFKFPRFSLLLASLTLTLFGHFTPQLHLVKHCLELGISADSASNLFIFIGLASSVARLITGMLCDISWVNPIFVYQFGVLIVGFMTIVLPLLKGYTGILLFALVYGVGDGIITTTMNSLLMFTVDEKRRAAAVGLGSSLLSLGIAGGPPLAGFLADKFDGYYWSFRVAGILMLCAGILPVVLVWLKKERNSSGAKKGTVELQKF